MKILFACLVLLCVKSILATHEGYSHGEPLNILKFTKNNSISVDYGAIDRTFLHPEVTDRKIVVISIIGALRKGKSFFMDYCLRFMYANYKSVNFMNNSLANKQDWIGLPDEPLKGFSWRSGAHRDTSGIVIWSDVFVHDSQLKEGVTEKIAIILMDTQGLFDQTIAPADNSRIFALGTLISSMQLFNLKGVVQEDQLEYLQMATDYARFTASKQVSRKNIYKKPFQNLMFLIRDWSHEYEYDFGLGGGAQYLADVLHIKDDQSPKLIAVRKYIQNSFNSVHCYLMPHPGFNVIGSKSYNGRWSELDEKFKFHLEDLIAWLLSPKNLKTKKILGNEVVGKTFHQYVKNYFEIFQSPNTPQMKSIYEMTIEAQLMNYVEEAMNFYKVMMDSYGDINNTNFIETLEEGHNQTKLTAVLMYKSQKKMGTRDVDLRYERELESEIDLYYNERRKTLSNAFRKMSELRQETEKEQRVVRDETETKFQAQTIKLTAERSRIEQEMAARERQIAQNFQIKEGEKQAEIQRLHRENQEYLKIAEDELQNLMTQQQIERKKIATEAANRTRMAEEQIKLLMSEEELERRRTELRLQSEREERQVLMKRKAEEEKEVKRIEQERRAKADEILAEERLLERERLALEKQKFLDEAQLATMRRQWEEEERENDRKRLQETRRLEKEELVRIEEMRELERQLNQAKLAKQVQLMQARQQTPNLGIFFKNVSCTVSLGLLC